MIDRPRPWVKFIVVAVALLALSGCRQSKDQLEGRPALPTNTVVAGIAQAPATPTLAPTEPGQITITIEPTPPTDVGVIDPTPTAVEGTGALDASPTIDVAGGVGQLPTPTLDAGVPPEATAEGAGTGGATTSQPPEASGDPNLGAGGSLSPGGQTGQPGVVETPTAMLPTTVPPTVAPPPEPTTVTVGPGVPSTQPTVPAPSGTGGQAPAGTTAYTVQRGDTLYGVARQFNTTVDAIRAANNLGTGFVIYVGQTLNIPTGGSQPATPSTPVAGGTEYTVQRGDTLSEIAARNNLTVAALATANQLNPPYTIFVGQRLQIPAAGTQQPQQPQTQPTVMATPGTGATVTPDASGQRIHVVQPGEWLYQIARTYNVDPQAIIRANNLPQNPRVLAGQRLIIP